jgi:hypothetical protein
MLLKFLHSNASATQPKAKRIPRGATERPLGAERPVRLYSLLLPPTLPRDRR